MSLLLDALKKAAEDKAKNESLAKKVQPKKTHQAQENKRPKKTVIEKNNEEKEIELSIEHIEEDDNETSPQNKGKQKTVIEQTEKTSTQNKVIKTAPSEGYFSATSAQKNIKISDEGLNMLIYKTNQQVKKNRIKTRLMISFVSLSLLIIASIYYYKNTQLDIFDLERKHKITMQAMNSKTRYDKLNNQPVVSSAPEVESDNRKQQPLSVVHKQKKPEKRYSDKPKKINNVPFLIEKTIKKDPVAKNILQAWGKYNNKEYLQSKEIYNNILVIEPNNRDALLGIAAIAIIQNNHSSAKQSYQLILRNNPNDTVAISALANLRGKETTLKQEENYLLEQLQKNKDNENLYFALGKNYSKQKKWRPAQQYFYNIWQKKPENANYIFNLAVSLDQLNKPKQAKKFYQLSLEKSHNQRINFSKIEVENRIQELNR